MSAEADDIAARLGLAPLPAEGGRFRRTWAGPEDASGRPAGSAIVMLLTGGSGDSGSSSGSSSSGDSSSSSDSGSSGGSSDSGSSDSAGGSGDSGSSGSSSSSSDSGSSGGSSDSGSSDSAGGSGDSGSSGGSGDSGDFSAMHRLPIDEVWHFHRGDPLELVLLHPDGRGEVRLLGSGIEHLAQTVVPAGTWMGARVAPGGAWSLFGATMAPGFVPSDYEGGEAEDLARRYPEFEDLIRALCRPGGPTRMPDDPARMPNTPNPTTPGDPTEPAP